MEKSWTREWPTKEGIYWFYGYDFGKRDNAKPKHVLIEVHNGGNSLVIVGGGHFWYKSEGADGWFMPAILPEPPKEGA